MNQAHIVYEKIRVEFDGANGPKSLLIPLVLKKGIINNLELIIIPQTGIHLDNDVALGESLQITITSGKSTSGKSDTNNSKSTSRTTKIYSVHSLPDFSGITFKIKEYEIEEDIGIMLRFSIKSYKHSDKHEYFSKLILKHRGIIISEFDIKSFSHPNAAKILLLSGYSPEQYTRIISKNLDFSLENRKFPTLNFTDLKFPTIETLEELITDDIDGIHLYTNIHNSNIQINGTEIDASDFFHMIGNKRLKLIYLDTCDSVKVIKSFRETDIKAIVAATENLYDFYAGNFEHQFYANLGSGMKISSAFSEAATKMSLSDSPMLRSGHYDPMFLDIKEDFSFKTSKTKDNNI